MVTKRRNPPVGKGPKPDKLMRDALILALMREAVDGEGVPTRKLHLIAARLVDKAVEGDISAIKEINDRVDGRPGTRGDDGEATPVITRIERIIVRPQSEDAPKGAAGL